MSYTLEQLAARVQGVVKGNSNIVINRLGTLENASNNELSFLANPKYQNQLMLTSAGAVLVKSEELAQLVENAIVVSNPYLAFAQLSHLFVPITQGWKGIHPSAIVSSNALIASNVIIILVTNMVQSNTSLFIRGVTFPNNLQQRSLIISQCNIHKELINKVLKSLKELFKDFLLEAL